MQYSNGINMQEFNKGRWIFKDIYGYGYPYYHIHPYKQEAVKYMVDNISSGLHYLIIFGSALHPGHMWWKDLDVCAIVEDKHEFIPYSMMLSDISYDWIKLTSMDELLYRSVQQKSSVYYNVIKNGVMVFEDGVIIGESRERFVAG